jgi:predicted phosphodiesterase
MAITPYTDADLIQRLKLREELGANGAAERLGIKPSALRTSIAIAKARGLTATTRVEDEKAKLETKVKNLEAELAGIKRDNVSAADVRERIYGLAAETPSPPEWLNETRAAKSPGVPMVFWSDFHWGEKVFADEMGGVNEFDRVIAKERFKRLVDTTLDLTLNHMVNPTYPGIVVCLGGDMITGGIHDELRETNDGPVQVSLLEVQEQLIAGLTLLADTFGRVFVVCVVGNHARMTIKPRAKHRVYESFEWNLYCQLEKHFRDDPRVQFLIPSETDAHFEVNGHRYMLTHGDALGVKGGDGIIGSLGPIARGTLKVGRSEAQVGRDFDTLLIGHWHTYIPRSEAVPVIVNGALKGYDEYAKTFLRARFSLASQALWFDHPKYGVTAQWQMKLQDDPNIVGRKAPWVSWEKNGLRLL